MRLQLLVLAGLVLGTVAKQFPWLYRTEGKPSKMLEVGRLPALGCYFHSVNSLILADNTWNAYYCEINETVVLDNAKFMNESGLLEAGYEYFVIDGTGPFISAILVLMSFKTAGWPISDLNQETFFPTHIGSHQESSL